jgi:hypothetical protein
MGWAINSAGIWWHNGSLPGTQTEQVHAENGFGFAAFFNTRPSNSDGFGSDLDNALWKAFNAVGPSNFGSVDLFDQYGAYTDWMSGVAYQSKFNSEQAAGKYPCLTSPASPCIGRCSRRSLHRYRLGRAVTASTARPIRVFPIHFAMKATRMPRWHILLHRI